MQAPEHDRGTTTVLYEPRTRVSPRNDGTRELSPFEEGIWLIRSEAGPGFHAGNAVRIHAPLDLFTLEAAYRDVCGREDLRKAYDTFEPRAGVHPPDRTVFRHVDVRGLGEAEVVALVHEDLARPFDLSSWNPFRLSVFTVSPTEHVLLAAAHHIASDAASGSIVFQELARAYVARVEGSEFVPIVGTPYSSFAEAHRALIGSAEGALMRTWWSERLHGWPLVLDLPIDGDRSKRRSKGASFAFTLPGPLVERLMLCVPGAKLFRVMLAVWATLLHRQSAQQQFLLATPASIRRPPYERTVGNFINLLVLRCDFRDRPSFVDVVARMTEEVTQSGRQRAYPFSAIVRDVRLKTRTRAPVVQSSFALSAVDGRDVAGVPWRPTFADLPCGPFPLLQQAGHDELGLSAALVDGTLFCEIKYDVDVFSVETVRAIGARFGRLMESAAVQPHAPIANLDVLPAAEQRVLLDWNATGRRFDESPVHLAFERQAAESPDAIALVERDRNTSYSELNGRANRLAHALRRRGVGPEQRVATLFHRSEDMIVAQLAVLKAGGAYAPLDPSHPPARTAFLVADMGAKVVLSTHDLSSGLDLAAEVINVNDPRFVQALDRESDENVGVPCALRQAAYVIYTSGSTGQPKGALIEHRSLSNLVSQHRRLVDLVPTDRVSQTSSPAFDATMDEIWPTLTCGAALVVVDDEVRSSSLELVTWMRNHAISVAQATTPMAELLLDEDWTSTSLRVLCAGGQALRRRPRGHEPFRLVNIYGPTEATDYVTSEDVEPGDHAMTTIGRPIQNTAIYILDRQGQLVPTGVYGEIHIGGANVGRGYVGRPSLTAERFLPDPFSSQAGDRIYRTGDRGRWLADGRIEFAGRDDDQVKVRGYRIELGEIETSLTSSAFIREAAVLAREDVPGDKRLVAYIVPATGAGVCVDDLKAALATSLPDYMVPTAFVVLDALPLTSSGKVDRKALPAPDFTAAAEAYVAPRDPTEEKLVDIFRAVLRVERLGIHDDFFALGGHSLLATQVVSRIRGTLGIELPIRVLFEAPTVAGLAMRVRATGPTTTAFAVPALMRVDRGQPVRASFAQSRLWFLDQLDGGSGTYNVPVVLRLEGAVNARLLERVLQALVERHETLRTTFTAVDGIPHQVVHPPFDLPLSRRDATSEEDARAIVAREAHAPFDLASGPILRVALVRLRDEAHLLSVCIHHIATDGWSTGVLLRELSALYAAFAEGKPSPLPPHAVDYVDFAAWQRAWLAGDVLARQLAFWSDHLAGAPAALELPIDRPRPDTKQHRGDHLTFVVPAEASEGVRALCKRAGATPFMVLLAAFQCVLARWSGQNDIVVGTPIANRTRQDIESVVGFFVNTLAIRTVFDARASFDDILARVKQTALSAYAHQDVPFEKLVEELKVPRDLSRTPLFQALFVMQNAELELEPVELPNLTAHIFPPDLQVSKFDLELGFIEQDHLFRGVLSYDVALFDRATMSRFVEYFLIFLHAAARAPESRVASLPLMSDAERQRVLVDWNATAPHQDDADVCVHELFEAQVRAQPDAVAVTDEHSTLTYADLASRAEHVAGWLARQNDMHHARVAISVSRSVDMITAVLGVLMAGAAYVPIDPKLPADRQTFMQRDASCVALLTDATLAEAIAAGNPRPPRTRPPPTSLAYVLYTSGSTGQPKGVMVEHRSVASLVRSLLRSPGMTRDDVSLALTKLSFDVAGAEIFLPLAAGARIVIATEAHARDASLLASLLLRRGVTVAGATPATWQMLTADGWRPPASLRIHTAGEALPRELADRLLEQGATLYNLYGPTETTIYSTATEVRLGAPITIGRPLDNTQTYVLDAELEPQPTGVFGELYIAGTGVARGYLDQPGLTAEKFLASPFAGASGTRMYRTGDIARWRADGSLEYAGRLDHQVKLRGFRIELGEIQSVLARCSGVGSNIVVVREDVPGDKRIVAYVMPATGAGVSVDDLKAALATSLPDYMVPTAFVVLDALPLTSSGKVDRKALPAPDFTAAAEAYVAPRDPTEEALTRIWAELLRLARVGVHDNFFELGGHSLRATQMVARVRVELGVHVPVRALFDAPTVAQLANLLRDGASNQPASSLVRLQSGDRARFVFVHALSGEVFAYGALARALELCTVEALRGRDIPVLPDDFSKLAAIYVDALLPTWNRETYLCGWSAGGVLAFEVARQLEERGLPAAGLVLLDSFLLASASEPPAVDVIHYGRAAAAELGIDLRRHADAIAEALHAPEPERTRLASKVVSNVLRLSGDELRERLRVFGALSHGAYSYRPSSPLRAPIHMLSPRPERAIESWNGALGRPTSATVPGDHYSMLQAPNVLATAEAMRCFVTVAGRRGVDHRRRLSASGSYAVDS